MPCIFSTENRQLAPWGNGTQARRVSYLFYYSQVEKGSFSKFPKKIKKKIEKPIDK
jgi:hypothetical protein